MQEFWLNKKNNKKLILIFNGWGMNETPFKHLDCLDYDILLLSDYSEINVNLADFISEEYNEKYLIAWSMGVYVSGMFSDILNNFTRKIAINGTGAIIDDNFGIPNKIFNITAKFLNETSLDKFIKNMFDGGRLNPEITITRTLENLKNELYSIKELKINSLVDFDKAIISESDRIIPPKNQLNFWKNRTKTVVIQATHCPFGEFKSYEEILWN